MEINMKQEKYFHTFQNHRLKNFKDRDKRFGGDFVGIFKDETNIEDKKIEK